MWVFLQLPDVTISANFHDSLQTAYSYAQAINNFIPVTELFTTIAVVFLTYEGYYLVLKVINWIIRKIPTIS
jgi:hypothetical protein